MGSLHVVSINVAPLLHLECKDELRHVNIVQHSTVVQSGSEKQITNLSEDAAERTLTLTQQSCRDFTTPTYVYRIIFALHRTCPLKARLLLPLTTHLLVVPDKGVRAWLRRMYGNVSKADDALARPACFGELVFQPEELRGSYSAVVLHKSLSNNGRNDIALVNATAKTRPDGALRVGHALIG